MSLGTLYTKFKLNLTLQMFDILVETYNWILVVLMQFWYINLRLIRTWPAIDAAFV